MPIRTWAPVPPAGATLLRLGDTLVASNFSNADGPRLRLTGSGKPGVHVPAGGLMATVQMPSLPLFGHAVFVVCTPAAVATGYATVLTDRIVEPVLGQVILRMDGPRMVMYVLHLGGYSTFAWTLDLSADETRVWGFEFSQLGRNIRMRCVPTRDMDTTTVDQQDLANVLGDAALVTVAPGQLPPGALWGELQIGGWRPHLSAETVPGQEHGNCLLHEIVVYPEPLSDGDMLAVYESLARKWE